jgi:site-specific recombinase XerD
VTKSAISINKNLQAILFNAKDTFDELRFSRLPFSLHELVEKLKGREEKPSVLAEYLDQRTKEIEKRIAVDMARTTYEKYLRSADHFRKFIDRQHNSKNFPLYKIDQKLLIAYFQYLRTTKEISHNTSVKYMGSLKTILMPVIKESHIRHDPFKELKLQSKTIYKDFLTQEEINQLEAAALPNRDLCRIRDIFLFSCYTGLAYADLAQLTRLHIVKEKEDYHIIKPRQKTGQQSIIPLLQPAINILQRYSLTNDFRDFGWHVSANQKMNQRLKKIGTLAGISKPLHMHLARHTFATTVTLSNGVPIETVSNMLGHATLRQTQHYAKVVALKIKTDMAKLKKIYEIGTCNCAID